MKKNTRFTMVMATAVMLLALTGCEGTGGDTTVTTPAPAVEATPTETSGEVTPTEEPVAEAAPTEDVAAPTEAVVEASNLEWEIIDFRDDGNVVEVGRLHDGEKFEAKEEDQFDTLVFGLKTEKLIADVEIISENDYFGSKSPTINEKKIATSLYHDGVVSYDNYEAKTVITYDDGTTDAITIYITIPEGVYK